MTVAATTAEWLCTRCGSTNRMLVATGTREVEDQCTHCHVKHLVQPGHLTLPQMLSLITNKPAQCLGIPGGTLVRGVPADLVLFDPNEEWTVRAETLHSKSRNSAFIGRSVAGRVKHTLVDGVSVLPAKVGV